MNDELYKVYFWYLDSGTCFGFWEVCSDSGKCFGFWDVFLHSGKCFGFWDVFLDSGKCFGFWDVFLDPGKCFGFWGAFCPYEPPYIVAVLMFLTSTHLFPTVFYLSQVKGLIFREKKAHRFNRTNDGESQPSNGLNKKNSSAGAAYFLVHFKVVAARLPRVPTDAAICSHAAPGRIFDRLKVRAFRGSVQTSNGSKFRVIRAKLLSGSC